MISEIRAQIEVMKTEVMTYLTLADSIKSFEERNDITGKDTEVKLCNTTRIHVRVVCSADQLTQLLTT